MKIKAYITFSFPNAYTDVNNLWFPSALGRHALQKEDIGNAKATKIGEVADMSV